MSGYRPFAPHLLLQEQDRSSSPPHDTDLSSSNFIPAYGLSSHLPHLKWIHFNMTSTTTSCSFTCRLFPLSLHLKCRILAEYTCHITMVEVSVKCLTILPTIYLTLFLPVCFFHPPPQLHSGFHITHSSHIFSTHPVH